MLELLCCLPYIYYFIRCAWTVLLFALHVLFHTLCLNFSVVRLTCFISYVVLELFCCLPYIYYFIRCAWTFLLFALHLLFHMLYLNFSIVPLTSAFPRYFDFSPHIIPQVDCSKRQPTKLLRFILILPPPHFTNVVLYIISQCFNCSPLFLDCPVAFIVLLYCLLFLVFSFSPNTIFYYVFCSSCYFCSHIILS